MELGAGSDDDLLTFLDDLLPRDDRWTAPSRLAGPRCGPRPAAPCGPSLTIPVVDGQLALGTWQSVALVDPNRDNATRTVRLSFLTG